MCRLLGVSRAAFYKWQVSMDAGPTTTELRRASVESHISLFTRSLIWMRTAALEWLAIVSKLGVRCSENTVAKLMRQAGNSGRWC